MRGTAVLLLAGALATTATVAEERRELGAHEHGHSTLAIAVEGTRMAMELAAPGADIVGFERPASTDEQKAAIEQAKAALADPLALFAPPSAAGCRVAETVVELETGESHGKEHAEGAAHGEAAHAEDEGHAEFHAEYALDCADPVELGSITFAFFERFPGAEEVAVTLLTDRGQTSYEVTRAAPRLVLDRLM
jgi:hypothetical protein